MYNMDISIFGFKLNVEILILIGVVYLILVGHTLCGCCNYSLMEAFTDASGNMGQEIFLLLLLLKLYNLKKVLLVLILIMVSLHHMI